jgi:NADPH:quinone reductase-like Zn-dependent oxidoreductase
MKAAVYSRYGPPEVVQIQDVEKPALGLTDVLIRVHATTLCPADWRYRCIAPDGLDSAVGVN